MSTSRKLAIASIVRVSHMVLATLAGFFMMPFLVGELGDHWYGIWVAVGSLVGSYYLIDFGLASAVTRFVTLAVSREGADRLNQVINTALVVYCALALVLLLITLLLVGVAPNLMDNVSDVPTIRHVLLIVGFTLALGFPFKAFAGIAQAYNRYDLLTLINITTLVLQVAGSVWCIRAGFGVVGLAYVGLIASVISDVLFVVLVRHLHPGLELSKRRFQGGMVKELFSYSSWSFVTQLADQVRLRIDALVVLFLLNASAVTHYFVGARLAELANNILYQATNIVTPVLTRYHAEGRLRELRESVLFLTRVNVAAAVLVSGGLSIFGHAFISRWMGPDFLDSMPVLYALSVAFSVGFMVNPLDNLLYAVAKHRRLAIINVGDALANLLLSLTLGYWLGLPGVAIGTLLPMLLSRILFVVPYGCKQIELPLARYFLEVARSIMLGSAVVVLIWVLVREYSIGADYLQIVGLGGGMVVLYSVVAWLLVLREEDRQRLLRILRKDAAVVSST